MAQLLCTFYLHEKLADFTAICLTPAGLFPLGSLWCLQMLLQKTHAVFHKEEDEKL